MLIINNYDVFTMYTIIPARASAGVWNEELHSAGTCGGRAGPSGLLPLFSLPSRLRQIDVDPSEMHSESFSNLLPRAGPVSRV